MGRRPEAAGTDLGAWALPPRRHDADAKSGKSKVRREARPGWLGDWRARVVASPVAPRHVTTRPLGL